MPKRIQHGGITRSRLVGRTVILAAPTGGFEPAVLPKSFPGARLYYVVYPSAGSDPSAAQIKAGQDSTGANAVQWGVEAARTTTGVETFAVDAVYLTLGTSYKIAFVWSDGVTDSSISVGAFSTTGGGTDTPVNPSVGSIAITGYAPAVAQTANQSIAPNVGNIVITGYAPTISQPQAVNPGVGSLTITGYAPTVTQNVDVPVNPGVGTIAITGYAPTVAQTANQAVAPNVGNIVITGYAPTISQPQAVNPGAGTITITGYAPTVTQNVDVPVNPGVGTIAITGYAPTVAQTANQSVLPATGTIAITGYSPAVSQTANQAITPDVGTITITGYAPIVQQAPASQNITPGVGTITITGYAPTVEQSSPLRLGGFEYGSKVYIKRNKKIYIFDSVEEADSYIEAEAKAEEIVQQSNKTSRLARKRAREKAHKLLSIEPVESVDIPALKTLVSQLQTDFELPQLIAKQDWQRVVEIYNQAMEMQDEEDLLLIL